MLRINNPGTNATSLSQLESLIMATMCIVIVLSVLILNELLKRALLAFCIINQLVLIGSLFTNRPTQKAMAGYNFMKIIKTWVLDYSTPISFSLVATFWGNDSLIITVINWVCGQHMICWTWRQKCCPRLNATFLSKGFVGLLGKNYIAEYL